MFFIMCGMIIVLSFDFLCPVYFVLHTLVCAYIAANDNYYYYEQNAERCSRSTRSSSIPQGVPAFKTPRRKANAPEAIGHDVATNPHDLRQHLVVFRKES